MVVFTCQHCGDSVNKPKVAKHYFTKCRNKHPSLTCVDCLKDFIGDEYDVHTQCVTEAERYSAKGTVFKENTGRNKQAKFVEMIQNLLNTHRNLSNNQRQLLKLCSEFDNVPRKHVKFLNFIKNVARKTKHTREDLDSVFNLIENGWQKEVQAKKGVVQTSKESSLIKEGMKTNEELGVELEEAELSLKTNTDSKKNRKEKHSESSLLLNRNGEAEANEVNDDPRKDLKGSDETKKTTKKKRNTSQCQEDDETYVENNKHYEVLKVNEHSSSNTDEKNDCRSNADLEEEMSLGNSNSVRESNKTAKEISKKYLKKQKKYERYLQELENESKSKDEDKEKSEDDSVYNTKKTLKKSKKHAKTIKIDEHCHEVNSNNVESSCDMEVEPQEGDSQKKNKKRKHNDAQSKVNGKKMKSEIALEGEQEEQPHTSFDWGDVIIRVLESRPDKELSLKKLGKKVINEYQSVKADHRTYEELLVRFNKKVLKTRRVRVLKEKAKIIE